MFPKIISLCGRAETGISRPFFCEAEDGHLYFVKRDNVSADQLVTEYVIGRLAEECGLPVAPIQILEITGSLADHALVEDAEEFRPGLALGSRRIPFSDEIRTSHLRQIDEEVKQKCLCFDWWVRNPDRCLDRLGGDPNVLWDPVLHSIFLIDHDRCLAEDFDPDEFKKHHVFRDSRPFIEEIAFRKWRTKFESAIYGLGNIWAELPPEWVKDPTGLDKISLTRETIESQLIKPEYSSEGILPS